MQEIDVKHIKQGQKNAFQNLFNKYFNALCSFAYNYIPDVTTIEDFVQESFIGFWEKKSDFDHLNAIKSFLYTSVRNKCLNHLRHQKVQQKNEESLVYDFQVEEQSEQFVIEEETFRLLHAEIEELPDAAKKIMILALQGLKNQEIADKLEISVNTVKTQKKIAYSKLKDRIKPSLFTIMLFF